MKPSAAGELPVRIIVKSESGEDARIAWLRVSERARKCPSCNSPVEPGANYCWKCGAKLLDSSSTRSSIARRAFSRKKVRLL